MPLAANALTTVAAVRRQLGRSSFAATAEETAEHEANINAFSNAIAGYTSRRFAPPENAVAKSFRYDGSGYLNLAPYELRAASLVEYGGDGGGSWLALTAPHFRLEPRGGDHLTGTFLWVSLPRMGRGAFPVQAPTPFDLEVRITGDYGPATVPPDVELACRIAAANAYRNPDGRGSGGGGDEFGEEDFGAERPGVGLSLPQDARALLGPYIRTGL